MRVPHWYLDDGYLDWGYALTGHKAQGATAQRAHTVVGDGVDREWIYVTMSRGREANTIYLTDPDMSQDECEHLAHQDPDRLPALIAALGRTAAEPAALDTGRGPQTFTDEQLDERLAQMKAVLATPQAEELSPDSVDRGSEMLIEYVTLRREAYARHQDRLATLTYQPPGWIVDTPGRRPSKPGHRAAWDAMVSRALRYRTEQRIPDDAPNLLGPEPSSSDVRQRVEWLRARRDVMREFHGLTFGHGELASIER